MACQVSDALSGIEFEGFSMPQCAESTLGLFQFPHLDTGMLSLYSNEVSRLMAKPVIDYLYMPNVHHPSVLPSSSHVVWTMESIGHTLSWSFDDHAVITAALDIYSKWIFDPKARPEAITQNESGFFQIIFLHLSQLFDSHRRPRTGVGVPGRPLPYVHPNHLPAFQGGGVPPTMQVTVNTSATQRAGGQQQGTVQLQPVLISQPDYPYIPRPGPHGVTEICGPGTAYRDRTELECHVKLGHTALNILAAVARTFSLSQDSWRLLLRVLLGITNAVFCDPATSVHFASRIEFHLVQTLFDVWVRATPMDPALWNAFASFSRTWLKRRWLIVHWRAVCAALTRALLSYIRQTIRGRAAVRHVPASQTQSSPPMPTQTLGINRVSSPIPASPPTSGPMPTRSVATSAVGSNPPPSSAPTPAPSPSSLPSIQATQPHSAQQGHDQSYDQQGPVSPTSAASDSTSQTPAASTTAAVASAADPSRNATSDAIRLTIYWPENFSSVVNVSPLELAYLWWQFHNLLGSPLQSSGPDTFAVMIEGIADTALQFLAHAKLRLAAKGQGGSTDSTQGPSSNPESVVSSLPGTATGTPVTAHAQHLLEELKGGPDLNQILALFGPWLFEAVYHSAPGYEDGRAVATAALCRIFSVAPATIHACYRNLFLGAICELLRDQPPNSPVAMSVIAHAASLFTSGLPAVDVIVPYLVPHLSYLLSCPEDIDVATRRGALLAFGALAALHAHLYALHTSLPGLAEEDEDPKQLDSPKGQQSREWEDSNKASKGLKLKRAGSDLSEVSEFDTDDDDADKRILDADSTITEAELYSESVFGSTSLLKDPLDLPGTIRMHPHLAAPTSVVGTASPDDPPPLAVRGLLAIRTNELHSGRAVPPPRDGSARFFPQALAVRTHWLKFMRQQRRLAKLLVMRKAKLRVEAALRPTTEDKHEVLSFLRSLPPDILGNLVAQVPSSLPLAEFVERAERAESLTTGGAKTAMRVEFSMVDANGKELKCLSGAASHLIGSGQAHYWPCLARNVASLPTLPSLSSSAVAPNLVHLYPCSSTVGTAGQDGHAAAIVATAERGAAAIAAAANVISATLAAPPSAGSTARSQELLARLQTSSNPLLQHLLSQPIWIEEVRSTSAVSTHSTAAPSAGTSPASSGLVGSQLPRAGSSSLDETQPGNAVITAIPAGGQMAPPACRCRLHRLLYASLLRSAAIEETLAQKESSQSVADVLWKDLVPVFPTDLPSNVANSIMQSAGPSGAGGSGSALAASNKAATAAAAGSKRLAIDGPELFILEPAFVSAKITQYKIRGGGSSGSGGESGASQVAIEDTIEWGPHPADPYNPCDPAAITIGALYDPITAREQLGSLPALLLSALTIESEGANLELIASLIANMVWQRALEASLKSAPLSRTSDSNEHESRTSNPPESDEEIEDDDDTGAIENTDEGQLDDSSPNTLAPCPIHMGLLTNLGKKLETFAGAWPESVCLSIIESVTSMAPVHGFLFSVSRKGVEELLSAITRLAITALEQMADYEPSASKSSASSPAASPTAKGGQVISFPSSQMDKVNIPAVSLLRCIFTWMSVAPILLQSPQFAQLVSKALSIGVHKKSQELYAVCMQCLKLLLHEAQPLKVSSLRPSLPQMLRGIADPAWPSPLHIGPLSRADAGLCLATYEKHARDNGRFMRGELMRLLAFQKQSNKDSPWDWARSPAAFALEIMSSPGFESRLSMLRQRFFARSDKLLWRLLRSRVLVDGTTLFPPTPKGAVLPESTLLRSLQRSGYIKSVAKPRLFLVNRKAIFSCCEVETITGRELIVVTRNVAGRRTWKFTIPAQKLVLLSRSAQAALADPIDKAKVETALGDIRHLTSLLHETEAAPLVASNMASPSAALALAAHHATSGLLTRLFLTTFGLYEPLEGVRPGWVSAAAGISAEFAKAIEMLGLSLTSSFTAQSGIERGAQVYPLRDGPALMERLLELDLLPSSETVEAAVLVRRPGQTQEKDFCTNQVWQLQPTAAQDQDNESTSSVKPVLPLLEQEKPAIANDANSRLFLSFVHALASHPAPDSGTKLLLRVPSLKLAEPEANTGSPFSEVATLDQVANCRVRIIWNEDSSSSWSPHPGNLLRTSTIQQLYEKVAAAHPSEATPQSISLADAIAMRHRAGPEWLKFKSVRLAKNHVVGPTPENPTITDDSVVVYIVITPLAHMGLYRVNLHATGVPDDGLGFTTPVPTDQQSLSGPDSRSPAMTPPFGLQMRSTQTCLAKMSASLAQLDEQNAAIAAKLASQSSMSPTGVRGRAGSVHVVPQVTPASYGYVLPGPFGIVKLLSSNAQHTPGRSPNELQAQAVPPVSQLSLSRSSTTSTTNSSPGAAVERALGYEDDDEDEEEAVTEDEDEDEDEDEEEEECSSGEGYSSYEEDASELSSSENASLSRSKSTTAITTQALPPTAAESFGEDEAGQYLGMDNIDQNDNDGSDDSDEPSEDGDDDGDEGPDDGTSESLVAKKRGRRGVKVRRVNSSERYARSVSSECSGSTQQTPVQSTHSKSAALAASAAEHAGSFNKPIELGYSPTSLTARSIVPLGNAGSANSGDDFDGPTAGVDTFEMGPQPQSTAPPTPTGKSGSVANAPTTVAQPGPGTPKSESAFNPSVRRWHAIGPLIQGQLVGEASLVHVVRAAAEIAYRRSIVASKTTSEVVSPFAIRHRKFVEIAREFAQIDAPSEAFASIASYRSTDADAEALQMFEHYKQLAEDHVSSVQPVARRQ